MTTPYKKKKNTKKPGRYVTIAGKKVYTTDPKTIIREQTMEAMGNAVDKTTKFFKGLFK